MSSNEFRAVTAKHTTTTVALIGWIWNGLGKIVSFGFDADTTGFPENRPPATKHGEQDPCFLDQSTQPTQLATLPFGIHPFGLHLPGFASEMYFSVGPSVPDVQNPRIWRACESTHKA